MTDAKSKRIKVNGVELNYYEKGKGEVLLFLHGNSMDSKSLKNLYQYFSKQYRVIAVDSRGHGKSEAGEIPYTMELFAEDMIAFCKQKKLGKVRVVGHSDGGNIALLMAKKCPEIINNMVLISSNYKVIGVKKWFRSLLKIVTFLLTPLSKSFETIKIKKWKWSSILKEMDLSERDLNQIQSPTLVLGAKNDLIYEKHTRQIQEQITGSKIEIIEKTNHFNIIFDKRSLKVIERFNG